MSILIRKADSGDLETINQIYNQAVNKRFQTADLIPVDMTRRKAWFADHDDDRYIVQVIEVDNQIAGWSSLSKYREGREALKNTAEISYYIDTNQQGKGLGSYLLEESIQTAKSIGFKNLVALLLSSNEISIQILKKYSFSEWGRIPNAANINNHYFDHLFYGRTIG